MKKTLSLLLLFLGSTSLPLFAADQPLLADPDQADSAVEASQRRLDLLEFQLNNLKSLHAQDPQDMTQVKTATSWVRKLVMELQVWASHEQCPDTDTLNKLREVIDLMAEEVNRDDAIDPQELQVLLTRTAQADHFMTILMRHHLPHDSGH